MDENNMNPNIEEINQQELNLGDVATDNKTDQAEEAKESTAIESCFNKIEQITNRISLLENEINELKNIKIVGMSPAMSNDSEFNPFQSGKENMTMQALMFAKDRQRAIMLMGGK